MSTTRFYKIANGTETFEKVDAVLKRIDESWDIAEALGLELGSPTGKWIFSASYAAGGVVGLEMAKQPDGWKKAQPKYHFGFYFPKVIKANYDIIKRIRTLPAVSRLELSRQVGYNSQFGAPGIQRTQEFILVEMTSGVVKNSFYATPELTADMIEIVGSEYETLSKLEEDGQ
jgi:hypothetical protein